MQRFIDVVITLGSAAAIGSFTMLFQMLKKVNRHDVTLYGEDGTNGHRATVRRHTQDIKILQEWKIREDTLSEIEGELIQDTGRRPERLRDKVKEN